MKIKLRGLARDILDYFIKVYDIILFIIHCNINVNYYLLSHYKHYYVITVHFEIKNKFICHHFEVLTHSEQCMILKVLKISDHCPAH